MNNDTIRFGDQDTGITISLDETDPHGLIKLDTGDMIHFLSASEALSLLEWLYQRRDTIYRLGQEEKDEAIKEDHLCARCLRIYHWSRADIDEAQKRSPYMPCGCLWHFFDRTTF
jgi:hypothetical protein